ncbi:MAG TPA: hypothetical protein VNV37_11215 [Solirubrobacteraceae bacterium]|jgi:hypothetical protein|nr:hypothetical protein [Solirubrobacteraceae bacterium]
MLLPLGTAAIVAGVLLWELALPRLRGSLPRLVGAIVEGRRGRRAAALAETGMLASGERPSASVGYDPGRELRAEQRARELLRSCVNEEEWAMYRDLGFLRVWAPVGGAARRSPDAAAGELAAGERSADERAPYAYLLYPHKPIVAYVPQTGALLNEYCVAFPDQTRPYGSVRLPDADDVLAKWMALHADERRLIADANMHMPGRQVDPQRVRGDLARLRRWERERLERRGRAARVAGGSNSVRAA